MSRATVLRIRLIWWTRSISPISTQQKTQCPIKKTTFSYKTVSVRVLRIHQKTRSRRSLEWLIQWRWSVWMRHTLRNLSPTSQSWVIFWGAQYRGSAPVLFIVKVIPTWVSPLVAPSLPHAQRKSFSVAANCCQNWFVFNAEDGLALLGTHTMQPHVKSSYHSHISSLATLKWVLHKEWLYA